ncbi:hypothetical protein HanRHA438_Chr14g0631491 [Helianthus annuus]|uniref:DUF7796 domain-containing protein n=2 Tax=Helianthus annuus TaxID=4232 RepID=A0A251SDN0_HELAN|nr:uncharacterized protein LOC110908017 [Helianthus annuus]KAF5767196.1 hypothetical protein HanXRQr2_Chr14g0621521 [Helianthus annuus]KAJ0484135.1 hypothetical protein HanHA89_Chr14g0540791 [Helianthus annuus]KAJ0851840.1 hypothetical protein HanRHA438_Chr14g0631491 [Helianthus annuus]
MKPLQTLTSSHLTKRFSDLKWRFLLLFVMPISLLLFFFIASTGGGVFAENNPFRYLNNLKSLKLFFDNPKRLVNANDPNVTVTELKRSRIAVCLVGGARRFEVTGPSIVEKVLEEYPNADLFVNSPLDNNSYKFSVLKSAPRIAAVRIFTPVELPESETAARVLTASNSPKGIQGLLQYFNLVEGCLTMIKSYQQHNNFTYNWIVRTRVDGYWSNPLRPDLFIPGHYVVPSGSSYNGLNDRFGVGDFNTSVAALSRLSMLPELDSAGFHELNSESAFQAQLKLRNVSYLTKRIPFCIVSDRMYEFPPKRFGVPVADIASKGPLSGVKCRPCTSVFSTRWAEAVVNGLDRQWSWTESANGTLRLCDGHGEWEHGWETLFDKVAGKKLAAVRKRVSGLSFEQCVEDFEEMRRRSSVWDAPHTAELCQPVR